MVVLIAPGKKWPIGDSVAIYTTNVVGYHLSVSIPYYSAVVYLVRIQQWVMNPRFRDKESGGLEKSIVPSH